MSDLVSIEVRLPSGQRGRAFLDSARPLPKAAVLQAALESTFTEEDDRARLPLLLRALAEPDLSITAFPGEDSDPAKRELHVYFKAPAVSPHPIFACVCAPLGCLEYLIETSEVMLETAWFQAMGRAPVTVSAVAAALEEWAARVWPGAPVPPLSVILWREGTTRPPRAASGTLR